MENNNTQEDAPVRLKRPGKFISMCWNYIKFMDDNDPRIIKCSPNHAQDWMKLLKRMRKFGVKFNHLQFKF